MLDLEEEEETSRAVQAAGRQDGRTNELPNGWFDALTSSRTDGCTDKRASGLTDGKDGRPNEQPGEWTTGLSGRFTGKLMIGRWTYGKMDGRGDRWKGG